MPGIPIVKKPTWGSPAKTAALSSEQAPRHLFLHSVSAPPNLVSPASIWNVTTAWSAADPGGGGNAYTTPVGAANLVEWNLGFLYPGTWRATIGFNKGPNRGVLLVTVNGTLINTTDGYASAYAAVTLIPTFTVAAGVQQNLRFTSTTKNASSTDTSICWYYIALDRTGP